MLFLNRYSRSWLRYQRITANILGDEFNVTPEYTKCLCLKLEKKDIKIYIVLIVGQDYIQ